MDQRMQDISTLREMQELQDKMNEISCSLDELDRDVDDVEIDDSQYDIGNVDECERLKESAISENDQKYLQKYEKATGKFIVIPIVAIAAAIVVFILTKDLLLGAVIAGAGFVLRSIVKAPIERRIEKEAADAANVIRDEYVPKLEEARVKDEKEMKRYEKDLKEAQEKCREEQKPRREELKTELTKAKQRFKEIKILSEKDMEDLDMIIDMLESRRADNVKEALLEVDKEKRRQEEEERRRQEAEAARLASLPGTVFLRVGSINTRTGKLQTVRNQVYVDGVPFGVSSAEGSSIQLNPGPHSIYAELEEAGYLFTSPTQSFVLSGSGKEYIKIMIKNARAGIYVCKSVDELMRDN